MNVSSGPLAYGETLYSAAILQIPNELVLAEMRWWKERILSSLREKERQGQTR